MTILFLISSLGVGGAEKQTVLDANLLAANHKVYLFYFKDGMLKTLIDNRVEAEQINKGGYLSTALHVREKIRELKVEIIHASLFAPIIISSLASTGTGAKVIWHFHSHEYDIPLKSKLAFRWAARLPSVKKILFVNHELLNYFSYLKFPASKTGVHYNHSEISDIPFTGQKFSPGRRLHIGYLGRVVPLKRVHFLVELAAHFIHRGFSGFTIHVVGDGEALNGVKESARELGVAGNMEFHGFQADTLSYYRRFDLFVNPSREECLSVAMIDAGMMGLPVVAFAVGGNNEIVVSGMTGYIVNDKEELFDKCWLLAQDEELRLAMGNAGREHCRNLFSREKHAEAFQNLYLEINGTY